MLGAQVTAVMEENLTWSSGGLGCVSGLLCGLLRASGCVCGEIFVSFRRADMDTRASASATLSSGREEVWGHTVR